MFAISGMVTYTPDWSGYEFWITQQVGRDIFFNFFITQLLLEGQSYQFVHIVFTASYAILLVFLVSRFTQSTFVVCVLYAVAIYIFYTTQIRFFMGYFSFFIGIYFWMVQQKKVLSVLMIAFALLNHASLLILLPTLFMFRIDTNQFMKRSVQLFLIATLFFTVFKAVLVYIPAELYLLLYFIMPEHDSSFLGALYTFLPSIFTLFVMHKFAQKKLKEHPSLANDKKFEFLYKFMVIPLLFLGLSFDRQVLGHRFILSSVLFQLMLCLYLTSFNTPKQNTLLKGWLAVYVLFFIVYTYVVSELLVESELWNMVQQVMISNPLLQYFF